MSRHHGHSSGSGSHSEVRGSSFTAYMREFIGDTVTIFTTSGGASGFGFTGVILSVNSNFVRLMTEQGMPPVHPLADNVLADFDGGGRIGSGIGRTGNIGKGNDTGPSHSVSSVVDIPIDRITAFTHNAL